MFVRLRVEGLGPLREASLTVKPVTCIVGRNATGKSLLLTVMYALSSVLPDFRAMAEVVSGEAERCFDELARAAERGDAGRARRVLTQYFGRVVRGLEVALSRALGRRLELLLGSEEVVPRRLLVQDEDSRLGYEVVREGRGELAFKFTCGELDLDVKSVALYGDVVHVEGRVTWCGGSSDCELHARRASDLVVQVVGRVVPSFLAQLAPCPSGPGGGCCTSAATRGPAS